jgi:hypothetical protein
MGSRTQQTTGTTTTRYLLDLQPGLTLVLAQTLGTDTTRFVHAPRGIHAASGFVRAPGSEGYGNARWASVTDRLDGLGSIQRQKSQERSWQSGFTVGEQDQPLPMDKPLGAILQQTSDERLIALPLPVQYDILIFTQLSISLSINAARARLSCARPQKTSP